MAISRLLSFIAAFAASGHVMLSAETSKPRATVRSEGMTIKPITDGPDKGMQRAMQSFRFLLGQSTYEVRYTVRLNPDQPDKALPSEGYVGMPRPCSSNWYHSGFIFVRLNGKDIGTTRLHRAYVSETGKRALADIVWDAETARVRIRFAGQAGDNKLLAEIAIEPKAAIERFEIYLRCYPSFFTAWHKRKGDRKVTTPSTTLNQGQVIGLDVKDNSYAVYYDTIFDVAKGEGLGPCAAMFSPDTVAKAEFKVGSYAVNTNLVCDPGSRSVRLAFWEFPKVSNSDVLVSFRKDAAKWAEELKAYDFTPAEVKSFDTKAELAELARLSRPSEVRKNLGSKIDRFRKQIEKLGSRDEKMGILQQAQLLNVISDYREFLWELKLAALVAE
ncbi:MAG: hypothetical protein QGF00_12810 [Planctomycetota bacterium]|jgi:hypothetical protein|nr:hypothetical protein [Planctomycetota bacterium]